ncbi:septin [Plakobranchus ocellatus]|uniref:Septin n=1 Tax=Plakobranchus ocellatus TaxID=259542 RepID=A0AAV4DJK2_9GAST|nr:septin [Plakobranchus ocellatus]
MVEPAADWAVVRNSTCPEPPACQVVLAPLFQLNAPDPLKTRRNSSTLKERFCQKCPLVASETVSPAPGQYIASLHWTPRAPRILKSVWPTE